VCLDLDPLLHAVRVVPLMDTWEIQAERKRNAREPRDWPTVRDAILAARGAKEGVVESPLAFEFFTNGRELFAEPLPDGVAWAVVQPRRRNEPLEEWAKRCAVALESKADVMIEAGREKVERTLVDALYDEKHGLREEDYR
jgi:hypothetical protein